MTLYEINERILACVDPETGEADAEQLETIMMERSEKLENIACWIKDIKAECDSIKAEEKALAERRQAKERKAESLRRYLDEALAGQKFETPRCVVSFRKSQKINITDLDKIPDDYLRYKTPEPDKTAIKAAIKDGLTVEGCELVDSVSMTIK